MLLGVPYCAISFCAKSRFFSTVPSSPTVLGCGSPQKRLQALYPALGQRTGSFKRTPVLQGIENTGNAGEIYIDVQKSTSVHTPEAERSPEWVTGSGQSGQLGCPRPLCLFPSLSLCNEPKIVPNPTMPIFKRHGNSPLSLRAAQCISMHRSLTQRVKVCLRGVATCAPPQHRHRLLG